MPRPIMGAFLTIAVMILMGATSHMARACLAPARHVFMTPYELIMSSSNVVLATNTGHKTEGRAAIFGFETIEHLSGALPDDFEIRADHYPPEALEPGLANDETFRDHRDYRFWIEDIARTGYGADCLIKPTFEIGETYLIFADLPHTIRSFEKIERPDDLWLSVVRRAIADGRGPGQTVFTLETFVRQFDTIYLAKCPQLGGTTPYITVLETIRGLKREKLSASQVRPHLRPRCYGTGLEFLYLSDSSEESVVVAPVFSGLAYFRDVAPGLAIIPFGQAAVEEIARLSQGKSGEIRGKEIRDRK